MTFHRVIKSNDSLGCFASIFTGALFFIGLFFLYAAFHNDDIGGKIFMIFWIAIIGAVFFFAWFHIFSPQEFEIMVSKDILRWGNVASPKKQKKLKIKDISCICFDCDGESKITYAIMKDKEHKRLPDYIIKRKSYEKDFKEYFINNFPEIIIRYGFPPKNECQSNSTDSKSLAFVTPHWWRCA